MTPQEVLKVAAAVLEIVPAARTALRMLIDNDPAPEVRRVRDILDEHSESEAAAEELRRALGEP